MRRLIMPFPKMDQDQEFRAPFRGCDDDQPAPGGQLLAARISQDRHRKVVTMRGRDSHWTAMVPGFEETIET